MSERCAFCPHERADHTYRDEIGSWCRPCNSDELTGPCASYFISVHEFEASSPERRGPHGTIRPDDCRRCGLGVENDAHGIAA